MNTFVEGTCPRCRAADGSKCIVVRGPEKGRISSKTHKARIDAAQYQLALRDSAGIDKWFEIGEEIIPELSGEERQRQVELVAAALEMGRRVALKLGRTQQEIDHAIAEIIVDGIPPF